MNEYLVPAGCGEAELIEKKSRFIARVWRVDTEAAATDKIKEMRDLHWDASHNVYAYILRDRSLMRHSDDGEPQGSSGLPVLNVFKGAGVFDVCCVVTRYFGGILLGTGGLARAYARAASLALQKAGTGTVKKWLRVTMTAPYSLYESILRELKLCGAAISGTEFGTQVVISALLTEDSEAGFQARLQPLSAGTISAEVLGEEYLALEASL
jgi:uncharacterized YigZ family protein